jgi:hypothetical protein
MEALAVRLSERPGAALLGLLAFNAVAAVCLIGAGMAVNGDQAEMFRELTPGTFLSFAQLLLIAAAAWAVHRRDGERRWWASFWGLSAVILCVFAFDEITQSAIFLSHALESLGVRAAGGFNDLEAVLLVLLFSAAALVVLPRLPVLLRHPRSLALFAVAVTVGLVSQGLDSFAPGTRWEFVAEESLKLAAEVFLIGGFLYALREVRSRAPKPAEAPATAEAA